jgi:molybdopterin-containing oxidoreductase family iron-sulfur binding subunit
MPSQDSQTNFALIRERVLATQERTGQAYWRSLEELAETSEFREFMEREYPQHAEEWDNAVERRTFLKLMGASLALAGLSGCVYQPAEKIVPYVTAPEEMVPGKPLFFATAFPMGGVATGLLVKSNEGRPTKIEGNPDHPNSRYPDRPEAQGSSATDLFAQASLLGLYDPDRSQTLTFREEIRPWTAFAGEMQAVLGKIRESGSGGAGLRFLTETVTSPTLAFQLESLLREFPAARWHQYEPAGRDGARLGAVAAFGQPVNTVYHFERADRIFSIDSDFLACGPGNLWYGRDFAAKRRLVEGQRDMNRLYVVESTPTNTGAKADHKLALKPSQIETFAQAVAGKLGVKFSGGNQGTTGTNGNATETRQIDTRFEGPGAEAHNKWIDALVGDLQQSRGRSIVIAGDEQSPAVHALAHAMNDALGNTGQTVLYTDPVEFTPPNFNGNMQSLRELAQDLNNGVVELLVVVGGNPIYNAPADLDFLKSFQKANLRVHLSLHKDETSEWSHWHIPAAHYLESWSDARSYDGTVSIIQPLIAPLYDGRTAHEMLAVFSNQFDRKGYDIVRDFWQSQMTGGNTVASARAVAATTAAPPAATPATQRPAGNQPSQDRNAPAQQPTASAANNGGGTTRPPLISERLASPVDFEKAWRQAVHDGYIANTALPLKQGLAVKGLNQSPTPSPQSPGSLEIVFRTDPTIYDGRFANNGWLQELPKPLSKLTWDNAALISPNTAKRLGLVNKIGTHGGNIFADTVTLEYVGRQISRAVPVWVQPGQPDDVITVHLGHGRKRAGKVGNLVGFNAYEIRTSDAPWFGAGAKATPAGAQYELAATQLHFNMENRDIVRSSTLADYLKHPGEAHEEEQQPGYDESMYPPYDYKNQGNGYAWGMAIDVSSCVGCSACVVACQSENNIPVVGKEQVMRSREMHWLRVDSYFGGDDVNNPIGPYFMPVPCMHCEQAPCEPVCPVHATVHDTEGTNNMVYNRCVGTRYCSNNCPYKVRRFNFLLYQDWTTPTYQLMRNPEVSVRSRGVMEKCTYCIQRIQSAKIESEKEGRHIKDGEIVTACQAVCPADAIVFGDINDPQSRVSQLKREERNYALLAELNTQPRTTYLSALRNPNPEIGEKA